MTLSLRRLLMSSLAFWLLIAVVALYVLYPPKEKLNFGIDLVGGTYITLGVKTNEAVLYDLQALMQSSVAGLKRDEKIDAVSSKVNKEALSFEIAFASQDDALKAQEYIEREYHRYQSEQRVSKDLQFSFSQGALTVKFTEKRADAIRLHALRSNEEVLRTRLNVHGVEEIPVYIRGEDRIVVELPDVTDPLEAKRIIGTSAMLEFRLVEEGPAQTKDELLDKYDGEIPEGMEILSGYDDRRSRVYFLVADYSEVTGRNLLNAAVKIQPDERGRAQAAVAFRFDREGGERFYDLTSQNIGRMLATVLDRTVISYPVIKSKIGSEGVITGRYTREAAQELATLLRSGAFTAPVTFEEERRIGPSLGHDSIQRGLTACLVGLLLIFVFGLYFYRLAGLFAFCALLYNLILVLFMLYMFGGTLTLPGIAGLVLTVGMAVDASILIYEKIKEFLAEGLPIPQAVRQGFSGVVRVIVDANITTFIVGAVLYWFGTGPIRGFAVTLMIGIVTTLITGLFFLRSIFEVWISRHIQKLSI
jgi:preprotein translocase subunit SecD